MSSTAQVLLALVAGLLTGSLLGVTQHPSVVSISAIIEPVGILWLNALRMTVIPLIVSLLVTGIAGMRGDPGPRGVGKRTMAYIALLLGCGSVFGALLAPLLLQLRPVSFAASGALQMSTGAPSTTTAGDVPSFAEWLTALVPANAISAAADGAVLPLVFFSVILGAATARLGDPARAHLLGFFAALREAMLVIVRWVLRLAPIGIFGLVFPFGTGGGLRVAEAVTHYLVLEIVLVMLAVAGLYGLVFASGSTPRSRFSRDAVPAQAVALSTRSSLASLPAMLDSARRMGVPNPLAAVVLPLAVTLMRFTSPPLNLFKALFVAAALGIPVSPLQIGIGAAVAVGVSLAAVGLPGQVSFMAQNIPIFQVVGVPLEPLALLLAVEVIPDMFMTVGNVTADLAVTSLVAGRVPLAESVVPAPALP